MEDWQRVKNQILYLLKMRGAQTATTLAEHLNVSPMAIRQHLQSLQTEQQVTYWEERRPLGRPVKMWQLTEQTAKLFPDTHADLMVDLLRGVETVFGEAGLDKLLTERTQRQIQTYRDRLAGSSHPSPSLHLSQAVAALAQARTQEGYMAEVIPQSETTWLLVENHCPICVAARTCQKLCALELEVFRTVLGEAVTVERVEHILQGDRRCAYQIQMTQPSSIESVS